LQYSFLPLLDQGVPFIKKNQKEREKS